MRTYHRSEIAICLLLFASHGCDPNGEDPSDVASTTGLIDSAVGPGYETGESFHEVVAADPILHVVSFQEEIEEVNYVEAVIDGGWMVLATRHGAQLFERDPTSVRLVSEMGDPISGFTHVAMGDDVVFAVEPFDGIQAFDVAEVESPFLLGEYSVADGSQLQGLDYRDHDVYAARSDVVLHLDVKRQGHAVLFEETQLIGVEDARDVALWPPEGTATHLLVADGFAGLRVLSLGGDAATVVGHLPLPGISVHIEVESGGGRVLLAAGSDGFHLVDIQEVTAPVLVATVDTEGTALTADFWIDGGHVVVSDWDEMRIWDLTDPDSPVKRAQQESHPWAISSQVDPETGDIIATEWDAVSIYRFDPSAKAPALRPRSAQVGFGGGLLGQTTMRAVVVDNVGNLPLMIHELSTSDNHFEVEPSEVSIDPGEFAVIDLKYHLAFDEDPGLVVYDQLTFLSDDPDRPSRRIDLYSIEPGLSVGVAAPDFMLLDMQAQAHQLMEYLGKVVVLTFFSTW